MTVLVGIFGHYDVIFVHLKVQSHWAHEQTELRILQSPPSKR